MSGSLWATTARRVSAVHARPCALLLRGGGPASSNTGQSREEYKVRASCQWYATSSLCSSSTSYSRRELSPGAGLPEASSWSKQTSNHLCVTVGAHHAPQRRRWRIQVRSREYRCAYDAKGRQRRSPPSRRLRPARAAEFGREIFKAKFKAFVDDALAEAGIPQPNAP